VQRRLPSGCESGGKLLLDTNHKYENGYLRIPITWNSPTVIRLSLPMPVQRVHADEHVKADTGRVALQRGPLVYCLEGMDNSGHVRNLSLPYDNNFTDSFEKDLLGGVTVVRGEALSVSRADDGKLSTQHVGIQAVPYYAWDNRQPGQMIVWLPEKPELAELPGEDGVLVDGVRIRASHVYANDTLTGLSDGGGSVSFKRSRHPAHDLVGPQGHQRVGFVSLSARAEEIDAAEVYWFDDAGRGSCRAPAEWRLFWLDGKEWKPVKLIHGTTYGLDLDQFNKMTFEPVKTREVKVEVRLKENFSGGILKWHVTQSR